MAKYAKYVVGDRIPMDAAYTEAMESGMPSNVTCVIEDPAAERGKLAFVKRGILIGVMSIYDMHHSQLSLPADFDAVIGHPDDIDQAAADKAEEEFRSKAH